MNQNIFEHHDTDANGNPAGGMTTGLGIHIVWQDGPLGRGVDRKDPNGAFVEGVIKAALGRLKFYQSTKFNCHWNAMAIQSLEGALDYLQARTEDREKREVEGTHVV